MLLSFAFLFTGGLLMAAVVQKVGLPRMIGFLVAGILLGPYVLKLFDYSLLEHAASFRKVALVIILIKAGLALDLRDLKQVGRPAILMSFLPASVEIVAYTLFAPYLLGLSRIDAALMGAVLSAVSPAVVVPRMTDLIERQLGTKKGIPQMVLAGASCDDIIVIVLFTTFLNMALGGQINFLTFFDIPTSIVLGVLVGIGGGIGLLALFRQAEKKGNLPSVYKVVLLLSFSLFFLALEDWLKGRVALSGLLAIMAMASVMKMREKGTLVSSLAQLYGKAWLVAEIVLFVLVGAAVDIRYIEQAGLAALLLIALGLLFRSLGVWISLLGTSLTHKEKLFAIFSYLPKATVQAAIGGIPLAVGLPSGQLILAVAVLGIVVTAPLGAILIDKNAEKLLSAYGHHTA